MLFKCLAAGGLMWKGKSMCVGQLSGWNRVLVCKHHSSSPCALVQTYPHLTSCGAEANPAFIKRSSGEEVKAYSYSGNRDFDSG